MYRRRSHSLLPGVVDRRHRAYLDPSSPSQTDFGSRVSAVWWSGSRQDTKCDRLDGVDGVDICMRIILISCLWLRTELFPINANFAMNDIVLASVTEIRMKGDERQYRYFEEGIERSFQHWRSMCSFPTRVQLGRPAPSIFDSSRSVQVIFSYYCIGLYCIGLYCWYSIIVLGFPVRAVLWPSRAPRIHVTLWTCPQLLAACVCRVQNSVCACGGATGCVHACDQTQRTLHPRLFFSSGSEHTKRAQLFRFRFMNSKTGRST